LFPSQGRHFIKDAKVVNKKGSREGSTVIASKAKQSWVLFLPLINNLMPLPFALHFDL